MEQDPSSRWHAFWEWFVFQAKRWQWVLLVATVLATGISAYFAMRLPLETDLTRLLPEDTPSLRDFDEVKKRLGAFGFYIAIIESPEPARDRLKAVASDLVEDLRSSELDEDIVDIYFEAPLESFQKYALLYADLSDIRKLHRRLEKKISHEIRKRNPYFLDIEDRKVGFYTGDIARKYRKKGIQYDAFMDPEFKRLAIFLKPAKPATDLPFNERFYKTLNQRLADFTWPKGWSYYLAGRSVEGPRQKRIIGEDIAKTSGLTVIVLLITSVLFFRSIRAIVVVSVPLLAGLSWTFALTYLFIGRISLISAFLSSILLGLGIDYGIHLYSRFKEERLADKGVTQALVTTFETMTTSIGFGAFTTSAAFLALSLARFQAFAEFGLMAFIGILCCLSAFVLLFPILIFFSEKYASNTVPSAKLNRGRYRYLLVWLAIGGLLNLAGVLGVNRLKFEYNFSKLDAEQEEAQAARAKLATIIERSDNPIIYDVRSIERLKLLDKTITETDFKLNGTTQSVLMFMPTRQKEKMHHIAQMHLLLQKVKFFARKGTKKHERLQKALYYTDIEDFSLNKLPDRVKKMLVQKDEDGEEHYFYYLYPKKIDNASRGILDFAAGNRLVCLGKPGYSPEQECEPDQMIAGASDSVVLQDILDLIQADISLGTIGVSFVVVVLLFFLVRNIPAYLLILLPLVSGLLSAAAILAIGDALFDSVFFKFNYMNIAVFPVLLGVGIDNGLHLYRRLREETARDVNFVMSETGNAVFLSNFTTSVGFSSLVFASHQGLASLGFMAALGIASIFVAYTTLFPFLAKLYNRMGWRVQ